MVGGGGSHNIEYGHYCWREVMGPTPRPPQKPAGGDMNEGMKAVI